MKKLIEFLRVRRDVTRAAYDAYYASNKPLGTFDLGELRGARDEAENAYLAAEAASRKPKRSARPRCSDCGDYNDDKGSCGACVNCGNPLCNHKSGHCGDNCPPSGTCSNCGGYHPGIPALCLPPRVLS